MKIILKIKDRFAFLGILPKQGNFEEMIIASELREIVDFTSDELEKYEMKSVPTQSGEMMSVVWNDKTVEFDYELNNLQVKLVKKQLKEIDAGKKITGENIDIYQLFMVEPIERNEKVKKKEEKADK